MYSNWSWIPMYCVSVIKSILGIKKPFIITPYQLYCALKKAGYKDYYDKIRRKNAKEEKEQNTRRNN